jgi:lipopolysaccharide export system permease protein
VAIPAAGFAFQRSNAASAQRDDRTMSAPMMTVIVDSTRAMLARKEAALALRLEKHVAGYLSGRPTFLTAAPGTVPGAALTTGAPGTALTRRDSLDAAFRALTDARQMQSLLFSDVSAMTYDDRQMDKYLVEIHKKYAIPVACLVFVLIGVPLGSMSRRGGFGIGAGLSLGFFLFYWICLISGEKLADRAILSPQVGMWMANALLGACGLLLTARSARESTVIDWTRFARLLPRSWRGEAAPPRNPHEAS